MGKNILYSITNSIKGYLNLVLSRSNRSNTRGSASIYKKHDSIAWKTSILWAVGGSLVACFTMTEELVDI